MFKSFVYVFFSFSFLCAIMSSFLFGANMSSRFPSIAKLFKSYVGGHVINNSRQPVTVYEWRYPHVLTFHQNSRDLSTDIDAIKIEKSTLIDGKLYNAGILKFCDTATILISDTTYQAKPARQYTMSRGGNLCKLLNDFDIFQNIEEAIPL
jgi:hypothetical protein